MIKPNWLDKQGFIRKSVLTLADCEWRAAALGLKPLRLPRARPSMSASFCDQVLAYTKSVTSEYSTTSQCLSALLGRLERVNFVLDVLRWELNQRTYHSCATTAW